MMSPLASVTSPVTKIAEINETSVGLQLYRIHTSTGLILETWMPVDISLFKLRQKIKHRYGGDNQVIS
jgi:hypothetical protein